MSTQAILKNLEPKKVFEFFERICSIPHGSYNTGAISDHLVDFAVKRGLKHRRDEHNNVIIWKDAAAGYENAPVTMLQGHTDMVSEKDPDCQKDLEKEGLDLYIEGDYIGAKGTTLGGDDGIAVAMMLAVLDSDDIPHGPLECLFTTDEEVGLLGALGLEASDLRAKYLINLDSETEKVFTVSCAGAAQVDSTLPVTVKPFDGVVMGITIDGLRGGHSGADIHLGRGNANIIMGRVLSGISKAADMRIITAKGGSKDNAIPNNSAAVIIVSDAENTINAVEKLNNELKGEFSTTDPDIKITTSILSGDGEPDLGLPLDEDSTRRVICYMFCVPDGVQVMSGEVKGLVQTSLNMGRMKIGGESAVFHHFVRSSVDSQSDELCQRIAVLSENLGGKAEVSSSYGGWAYEPDSVLRDTMVDAFKSLYGEEPGIEAIHAGLECGVLASKIPGLDCISIGPDIRDIHTTRERLYIDSTKRTWELLLETLKRLK